MKLLKTTYRSLLADVSRLSQLSEIRGMDYDLPWIINDAPKLEKHVLECIENRALPDLDMFPVQLHRLVVGSFVDPIKLRLLRQLLLFAKKALVQHDQTTTEASFKTFAQTNNENQGWFIRFSDNPLLGLVRCYIRHTLKRFDGKDIRPFHGPGASTTPKIGAWRKWYDAIEYIYPYSDYFSLYQNREQLEQFKDITDEHITAKLIAVPKDSGGPRLICVHPAEAIWIQQGLRIELERVISRSGSSQYPGPKGHVHFDDQSVNGTHALNSSLSRKYATIDMKEASDRISEVLVQLLFGEHYKYFGCCRAQKYCYKSSTGILVEDDLHCYAPMGNATTFPVQSLVFWAICCASMRRQGFHQPDDVYVFGDDIIVPTECAEKVIDDLESFGLRVNRSKSFYRGAFRESCGVDAYKGIDVTPVRWRLGTDTESLRSLQALSDLGMRLRMSGFEESAVTVFDHISKQHYHQGFGKLGLTNNPDHGGIAEYCLNEFHVWRDADWRPDHQWFSTRVTRVLDIEDKSSIWGWNPVLESVLSLERSARSNVPNRAVSRRQVPIRGWTTVL